MFHIPVCPYCHAVYRYAEVYQLKGRQCTCYHCHKPFAVNKKRRVVPVALMCVVLIAVNLFVLSTSADVNLFPLAVIDAIGILISLLLAPFMVRFQVVKITKSQKKAQNSMKNKPKISDKRK